MKQRIQGIIIGVVLTAMVFGGLSVFAALPELRWQSINVATGGFNIVVDGIPFEARDVDGSVMEPFNYNGWIWAPFEHIAGALGKHSAWDGGTRTLSIITPSEPIAPLRPRLNFYDVMQPFEEVLNPGAATTVNVRMNQTFGFRGDQYTGVTVQFTAFAVNSSRWSASYNLRGQYTSLSGILGRIDGETRERAAIFAVYLDGVRAVEVPLSFDMSPHEVYIDLTGVQIMTIVFQNDRGTAAGPAYGFANVTIY
jgi:hypothetical protein